MKTFTFSIQQTSIQHVDTIKSELKNIGVNKFDIDFESKQLCVTCPFSLNKNKVECALQKAGIKCKSISALDL